MAKTKVRKTSSSEGTARIGGEMSQAGSSGKTMKVGKLKQFGSAGKPKKRCKTDIAGSSGSSAGLSAEISQLVQSMASDAEKIGEEWTTAADLKSTALQGEDAEAKQARLANAANEDAEILGGESDAELSDSSDNQEDADKPAAGSADAGAVALKKGKKKVKTESKDVTGDRSSRTANVKPTLQQAGSEQSKVVKQDKAGGKSKTQPVVQKRQKQDGQVYLSGLPFSVDEDTVRNDFGKFGEIARFFFHRDADKKPLGTACIFYKAQEVADKVMLLDGIDYKGRNIKVKSRGPRQSGGKRTKAARAAWERMPDWKTAQQLKAAKKSK
eukprot:TRINITY_DN34469_c0_g1_i1.p1 TRINITY_DN34469_c0_g1~~TRINITY_DN34469_c0_g1_i1.p1  ORF type:complete len:340 (+),score=66.41 TRINITY_DN34469_c0_g1_i1:42-1022(+)